MTLDELFSGHALARTLFEAVRPQVEAFGEASIQVSKSQIAFRRRRTFAAVWMPEQYLKRAAAPLVLTVFTRSPLESPRWKQVVEPAPGRFTHHLELRDTDEVDEEVTRWLRQAWEDAG